MQTELDTRQADVEAREAREAEVEQQLQLAVHIEIGRAQLGVQRAQAKQRKLENDAREADLAKNIAELGEREAEIRDREESCATLVEDHSAVSRDFQYLVKQKAVLESEIERMIPQHAALAATFHRLRAEVKQMPVEP